VTIRELGSELRSGRVSSAELVERAIARARECEEMNLFITVTDSQARERAAERDRELRRGEDRGPLHGVPIAFKDLFYTRGVRTTAGSPLFADFVPEFDGEVVARLEQAGAISIGKTNLHELAFGITSRNPHYGPVINPLDKSRLAGGSSGGSAAAVAAGIIPVALGTDTGGSVRIPASFCGIVGLKPTYERVSRRGILPLAFTLDHVGPLGASVEDCALALNAMVGTEEKFDLPASSDLSNIRIGVPRNFFFERVAEAVEARVRQAISLMESAGAKIIDCAVPNFHEVNAIARVIQFAEFASLHTELHDASGWGADVRGHLEQSRMIAAHEYVNAQRLRTVFRREMDALWKQIDILVTPTTPATAPLAEEESLTINGVKENTRMASTRLVRGINCVGEPALSMPCGNDENGLPIGLQMIAPPFAEAKLLQICRTLEGMLQRQI
jgi:aspartyl-tRNA(Asn)/glutamyl-tRNA(Gln) amidotransferase subunit A